MIAIKGMEMPSCCEECNLTCCKGYDEPWNYCCSITLTDINLDDTEKPSDCPLVEIKEHKLERIEQIVERFKSQYDHTSSLDLMVEIKEVLDKE